MTATELYRIHPTFRLLIDEWVTEKRCPLPVVDLLLEEGLYPQAECCRWAATEPDRRRFLTNEYTGPYPTISNYEGCYWCRVDMYEEFVAAKGLLADHINRDWLTAEYQDGDNPFHNTITDAILWLIDHCCPTATEVLQ